MEVPKLKSGWGIKKIRKIKMDIDKNLFFINNFKRRELPEFIIFSISKGEYS